MLHNNDQNLNLNNITKITDDTELSFVDVDDDKIDKFEKEKSRTNGKNISKAEMNS